MNPQTKAKAIAITIIAATAVMIAGITVGRMMRRGIPHVEIDRRDYPVSGLDLSSHNGKVDFDSLRQAGVDFVFLKASEGISFRDPVFLNNYTAARSAGLKIGAYHFFRFDCDGRRQAANLLQCLDGLAIDLPVAIDVEEWGNPAEVSTETIVARLQAMADHLSANGHTPVFYTNRNGHIRFIRDNFDDSQIWICSFTDPPLPHGRWLFWQHSHRGRIPGVKGNVDLNTFNGSRERWNTFLDSISNKP